MVNGYVQESKAVDTVRQDVEAHGKARGQRPSDACEGHECADCVCPQITVVEIKNVQDGSWFDTLDPYIE